MNTIEKFITKTQSTKNLSTKTIAAYISDLTAYQKYLNKNITKSNNEDIYMYINTLSQKGLKDTTIKRKLVTFKLFYTFLYQEKLIKLNPLFDIKFSFKQEKRLPKTLTIKEVSKLINVLIEQKKAANTPFALFETTRDLCLIDIILSTGIRIGEAAAITIPDIIFQERTILIHGKGRKQRLLYISSQDTWNNLKEWLKLRSELKVTTNALFINRYHNSLSIYGIENIFKKYKNLAQISNHATPHYLRHTFATNLLSNGADLRSVQEILGHANITTTEIYTEVTLKRKKQVLTKYNYRNKLKI